jgi:hypothetical protein
MNTRTLTGRVRHRAAKTFSRRVLLVLQVEERWQGRGVDEDCDGYNYNELTWRDATVEDLSLFEGMEWT